MKIKTSLIYLQHKYPFTIARRKGTAEAVPNVRIEIEHEGVVGLGEARPSAFYGGETVEIVLQTIEQAKDVIGDNPFLIEDIAHELLLRFPNSPAAAAGIDIALHDLVGKKLGVPLYQLFGLNPQKTPLTSYTIGLDSIEIMLKKLKEAAQYPIIKVKVGVENDIEIVKAIRDNTDAVLRLDANTGWTVSEAIKKINQLEKYGIEFIEQPIKPGDYAGLAEIKRNTNIAIMADEDCTCPQVLGNLAGCVDSINIKLMKCRGLCFAKKMINTADSLGLKVMFGCMTESSLPLTAAAHLTPMTKYADLDMQLLITNDPYEGLKVSEGKIILPQRPGVGAVEAAGGGNVL